jgi:hypothetical protein
MCRMNKWMFRVCKRQHTHVVFYIHLFILHMLSFTFICSSYTCCLLHSFVHPTHVVFSTCVGWTNECAVYVKDNMWRMNKWMFRVCKRQHVKDEQRNVPTFICSSYTCCLLHTRNIHLFILHMLSFTYTAHSFVHPSHVVFYIHGKTTCVG